MTSKGLLNANQQRRVSTSLRMLRHEMTAVSTWPEVARAGEATGAVRALTGRIASLAEALETHLGLPAERPVPAGRRLAATAEVWANRLADVHAKGLRAYGKVHPDLAGVLDGRLDEMIRALEDLAQAGAKLPR